MSIASTGVDLWHLDTVDADPQGFVKEYAYNLVVNASGDVIRGEWTKEGGLDSIDDHPDFAWVPYANEARNSSALSPQLHHRLT